jgi:hypothetical protein
MLTNPTQINKPMLIPIREKGVFYRITLDLIDFSSQPAGPDKTFHYIAHAVDHVSTFHFVDALRTKHAYEILQFVQRLFSQFGYCKVLQTDNGSEFVNETLQKYLEEKKIKFVHGKPYHPQSQGKVERGNGVLQAKIHKMIFDSKGIKTWYDVMYDACWAMNHTYTRVVKATPYDLVFRNKQAHNGIDSQQSEESYEDDNSDWVESRENYSEDDEKEEVAEPQEQENTSDQFTENCLSNYNTYVGQMKENYDKNRLIYVFAPGDCVGVRIPLELRKHGVQMIPAIVIQRLEKPNDYVYQLGVKGAILDRYYMSSDLVPLSLPAFKEPLGIPESLHVFDLINGLDWWGWDENKQSHASIELSAAYELYVKQYATDADIHHTSSTVKKINHYEIVSANADIITLRRTQQKVIELISIDDDMSIANDLISLQMTAAKNKTNMTEKPATKTRERRKRKRKNVISDNICCVCEEILSSDNWHKCHNCKLPMHGKLICSRGSSIIVDEDDDSVMYCSVPCSQNK